MLAVRREWYDGEGDGVLYCTMSNLAEGVVVDNGRYGVRSTTILEELIAF